MQVIEKEAIEEQGRDCQSFLTACGASLQACPPETHGILMSPLQLLMENMFLANLLATSLQPPTAMGEPTLATPHPTALAAPIPISGTKW